MKTPRTHGSDPHLWLAPSEMAPEERLAELAAILTQGCLRFYAAPDLPAPDSPASTEKPLDVSGQPTPPLGRLTDRDTDGEGEP